MENSFSLLGNVEGDASAFLERLAAEAKAEDQKHKRSTQQFVRTENGEGKRGQATGLRRYARNNGQLFENGHGNQRSSGSVDGWKRNNGGGNDYQHHQSGASWRPGRNNGQQFGNGYGNQKSSGIVDGWKRNNGGGNGYKQGYPGYGRGDGGVSGRGRGLVGAPNGINGAGKNSQIVEGNQQGENQGQGGDTGGDWEKVVKKQQRNQNSSYRGGRGGNGNGYWRNNSRPKEASGTSGSSGNHSTNGDIDIGNFAAATQLSKDEVQDYAGKKVEEEQAEQARENIQEETEEERITRIEEEQERIRREARRKAWEEEQKKMTLKQYENKLLGERKTLEDLKTEERKVIPDKDFESMQLVRKKKEDSLFTNQDTENGKLKKKDSKVVKSMSIDEFLKPAKGENRNRGIQGRGRGEYQRGTSSQQATYHANGDRFPQQAGRKEYVANFDRLGGPDEGGSSRRGSFQGRGRGGHQEGTLTRQATDRANGDRFPQPAGGRDHTTDSNGRGGGGGRGGFARGSSADAADPTAVDVVKVPAIHDSTQFPHLGAPAVK